MSDGRLVLLTGATGFLGGRLARRLAAAGWTLRCFVRAGSATVELERLGAEIVTGDIASAADLTAALTGAAVAYHLAAIYDVGVVDEAALERTNVGGTAAFLAAVAAAATPRAIYVSTTMALGPVPAGTIGDATHEHPGPYNSAYERTRAEAHRLAVAAQGRGLPLLIACPANVYGPGDAGPNGRFIADLLAGRVPGLLRSEAEFGYVHVDDVAEGLFRMAEQGRVGQTYVLSGEVRGFNGFAAAVAAAAGRRLPPLRLPLALARLTGRVLDPISRVTGLRFPVTREGVDTVAVGRYVYSHEAAGRDLGFEPRPLSAGLPETVGYFQERRRRGKV
jgi:nucleoside-diphosphate-sugar epimerase